MEDKTLGGKFVEENYELICRHIGRIWQKQKQKGNYTPKELSKDDLLQATFERLLKDGPKYDANRSSLSTYIGVIANRVFIDAIRKWSHPKRDVEFSEDYHSIDDLTTEQERFMEEMELLKRLYKRFPKDLELLKMVLDSFTNSEIMARGYVYADINAMRKELKRCLIQWKEERNG